MKIIFKFGVQPHFKQTSWELGKWQYLQQLSFIRRKNGTSKTIMNSASDCRSNQSKQK